MEKDEKAKKVQESPMNTARMNKVIGGAYAGSSKAIQTPEEQAMFDQMQAMNEKGYGGGWEPISDVDVFGVDD